MSRTLTPRLDDATYRLFDEAAKAENRPLTNSSRPRCAPGSESGELTRLLPSLHNCRGRSAKWNAGWPKVASWSTPRSRRPG